MANTNPNRNVWDIDTNGVYTLIDYKKDRGNLKSIRVSNQHASTAITFDLYLEDGLGNGNSKIYVVANMSIPSGATLELNDVGFDNNIYSLVFNSANVASAGPVNIIAR